MERKAYIALAVLAVCRYALGVPVGGNVSRADEHFPKDCGRSPLYDSDTVDRIVGGRTVPSGAYPFMVSLREDNPDYLYSMFEHVCGGVIVDDYTVLTAAHCPIYKDRPDLYQVAVGLNRVNELSDRNVKVYNVDKIILHENYNDKYTFDDICILRLAKPIQFSDRAQPICMPTKQTGDYQPDGMVTVIGWGWTVNGGRISTNLQQVTIPMVPRKQCNRYYDDNPYDGVDEITNGMICAGSLNKDACQYDSGGPLFRKVNGRYTSLGIVSFGGKCGSGPGVYTNVAVYMDWIKKNMA